MFLTLKMTELHFLNPKVDAIHYKQYKYITVIYMKKQLNSSLCKDLIFRIPQETEISI